MRPKVLFLENGPRRDGAGLLGGRMAAAGLDVEYRWAYREDFPATLDPYHALFLSDSPCGAYEDSAFIHREHDLIGAAAQRGLPMLGVCFGSQILGSALCGRDQVFRRTVCEVGFKTLTTSREAGADALAGDVGERFSMFVWHNDEVRSGHADMVILASTADCPNQVWRYRDRPVWGIQGHPEVGRATARDWLEARRQRLEHDGANVDRLIEQVQDSPESESLLENFISFLKC